jgi:hypothetical protein
MDEYRLRDVFGISGMWLKSPLTLVSPQTAIIQRTSNMFAKLHQERIREHRSEHNSLCVDDSCIRRASS